jgi:hypothetical protein
MFFFGSGSEGIFPSCAHRINNTLHFAYRRKSFAPAAENSPLEEGSQVKPDEEAWLDDMETESA